MDNRFFGAFLVVSLLAMDVGLSNLHADSDNRMKFKIYEVDRVSRGSHLNLRAWPSTSSRVKAELPYNAKDVVALGKQRIIGNSLWVNVKWQEHTGWVNEKYLNKTGVLVRDSAPASRNTRVVEAGEHDNLRENISVAVPNVPYEFSGDRYQQASENESSEVKTAVKNEALENIQIVNRGRQRNMKLACSGISPKPWDMTMDVNAMKISLGLTDQPRLNVPIAYSVGTLGEEDRVEVNSGGKGRNQVAAVLAKTESCKDGISKVNFPYQLTATVNNGDKITGCCQPVR